MNQFCRDVLWHLDHMAAQELCILSLMLTVMCYLCLRGFGSVYRL